MKNIYPYNIIEELSREYQSTIDRNIHRLKKSKRDYTLCKAKNIENRIQRFDFCTLSNQINSVIDVELNKFNLTKSKRKKKKIYILNKIRNKLKNITRMYANMIFKNREDLTKITEDRIQIAVNYALGGFFGCP